MTVLDHTTARWADGASLMTWLDALATVQPPTAKVRRRVDRWRCGAQASFWHVDELLTSLELHVSQVPCEIWCQYDNGRRRCAAELAVLV
jgi:hypothetical protein